MIVFTDVFLNHKTKVVGKSFVITNTGEVSFCDDTTLYQLLPSSRLSFVGCWLVMKNIKAMDDKFKMDISTSNLKVFLFRRRVNNQDFSTLARILSQL
jgi:hypothetical protein